MKIFAAEEIRQLDQYTITHEPIKSIDLMERASIAVVQFVTGQWTPEMPMVVFAGPGNNGGDALAVSRLLAERNYKVKTYLFNTKKQLSADCEENKRRLMEMPNGVEFHEVISEFEPPTLKDCVVIDGLFGTGLTKTLTGGYSSLVKYINAAKCPVVSIDVPSGLMTEDNALNVDANVIRATYTLTFQQKKLSYLFDETQPFLGTLKVLDIGLSKQGMTEIASIYTMLEENDIKPLIKSRPDFAHKGSMGSALIVAGKYGMAGASVLATKACLKSGAGKVTALIPKNNNDIMQISVPEAVIVHDKDEEIISDSIDSQTYNAVAIGPGIGTDENTAIAVISQIRRGNAPCILDADALNVVATHRAWLMQLPKGIILTPHPKELERLVGHTVGCFEALSKARELARTLQGYVILKGHYSALCTPDGSVIFNSTGNSGMATAGSGDVLTGILAGLLARGYSQEDACKVGMYVHGLAGDMAMQYVGKESLMASDIITCLPKALMKLEK